MLDNLYEAQWPIKKKTESPVKLVKLFRNLIFQLD